MKKSIFILAVFTVIVSLHLGITTGSKILSISMMSSKSHKNVYEPLLIELANRGHQITVVSPLKSGLDNKNIREILGIPYAEMMEELDFFEIKASKKDVNPFVELVPMFEKNGKAFLRLPQIQSVLKENFDLVIFSGFMNDCVAGILPQMKVPYIITVPFAAAFFHIAPLGNPTPLAFTPNIFLGYTDKMTFFQRVSNMISYIGFSGLFNFYYYPRMEAVYRDFYGPDSPSVVEILKNASLVLSNSHFTLNYPRPLLPEVIDVGGMHCRPSKPLPQALEEFVSGSGKDGFIYFSMGSVVKGDMMPEKSRKMFLNVFSKLKQRVIWKWESETMEGLPKNVKLAKWLPQQDILGHPNLKMFITHGGLLSTEEAVYHGVPLIGFPMFGDQDWNMKHSENLGFALSRDFFDITEDELLATINRILTEPKFSQNVKAISAVFRDRPQKPLETAVFWTEYVMRHKGAVHLRSAARDLNDIQYHSLDVVAFLLGGVFTVLYILFAVIRFIFRKMCGSSKMKKEKPSRRPKKD